MDDSALVVKIHDLEMKVSILQTELECSLEARTLQAAEYERRLSELNHAHQQQLDRNAEYVSRELFESRKDAVDRRLNSVERFIWLATGIAIAGGGIIGGMINILK